MRLKRRRLTEDAVSEDPKPEPIADFNALRAAALAGGNMSARISYEEADELIPEETHAGVRRKISPLRWRSVSEESIFAEAPADEEDALKTIRSCHPSSEPVQRTNRSSLCTWQTSLSRLLYADPLEQVEPEDVETQAVSVEAGG